MTTHTRIAGTTLTSEINITPMIDVLLVLLIIFMAALPSRRKAVDVRTPDRHAGSDGGPSIVLEIEEGGGFRINSVPVPPGMLAARLHSVYDGRPEKVLFVKGNPRAKYDLVLRAMDVASGAGVKVIGLP